MRNGERRQLLEREAISRLVEILRDRGYRVIGPVHREGAILYDEITSAADLSAGWIDEQGAGSYGLKPAGDGRLFGHTTGVQSWKRFLRPPRALLFRSIRKDGGFEMEREGANPKYAFLGVRACELHAIEVQDRVFLNGPFKDRNYEELRRNALIIAAQCTRAGGTCFCDSMKTGPGMSAGFDLALTELMEPKHCFIAEAGSPSGEEILAQLPHRAADAGECHRADELVEEARKQMGRTLETEGIQELLYRNYDNRRWEQVASRCLSCTNCTMVCPTCFCTTVEDVTDLSGNSAERWHRWDSCFALDFSYIHGGTVRTTVKSRYRQWLIHKLATWIEQFGTSGCVGCGRCITWCPVGIDITEEARAIRESDRVTAGSAALKE